MPDTDFCVKHSCFGPILQSHHLATHACKMFVRHSLFGDHIPSSSSFGLAISLNENRWEHIRRHVQEPVHVLPVSACNWLSTVLLGVAAATRSHSHHELIIGRLCKEHIYVRIVFSYTEGCNVMFCRRGPVRHATGYRTGKAHKAASNRGG